MAEPLTVIVERLLVRIHFCTTNFPMEVIAMLDYACSHNLYRRPKRALETLVTGDRGRHALGCDNRRFQTQDGECSGKPRNLGVLPNLLSPHQ